MIRSRALVCCALAVLLGTSTSVYASWDYNGTPICTETNTQDEIVMTTDGAGGAIVAWHDSRGANGDIYAQRIDAVGTTQWTPGGVLIGDSGSHDYSPLIVSDDAGGAIIVWEGDGTRGQRVDASGALLWGDSSGVIIDAEPFH